MKTSDTTFRQVISRLGTDDATPTGARCVRVGRNDVWKVSLRNATFYVARCASDAEFGRRVLGAQIAVRMAQEYEHVGAAAIEAVFPEYRSIVTREFNGVRVDRLLRSAYRIDKNPFLSAGVRGRFETALQRVLDYLQVLHDEPLPDSEHLWDHGAEQTRYRVLGNLERLSKQFPGLRTDVALPDVTTAARRLIVGDSTLGNFLFDGSRVACVDFEDLGIGEPQRDYVVLAESLRKAGEAWHYWTLDVERLIKCPAGDCDLRTMYLLELNLLRIWKELGRPWWASQARHEVAEASRILRQLNSHQEAIA